MFGDDSEREQFFEAACLQAQRDYEQDNTNVQALVRWGGALLELAHFKTGKESVDMIQQAIVQLQKAVQLDPERPDADWCLGNAYTSLGFLQDDKSKAQEYFTKASECFKKCQAKEPANETYKKALEMCDKAPEYYDEIQTHIQAQQLAAEAQGGAGGGKGAAAAGGSEFWWDLGGWVLLGGVIVGAMVLMRSSATAANRPAA